MAAEEIYLDNAATTRPYRQVCDCLYDMMYNHYGNASALHKKGFELSMMLPKAEEEILRVLGLTDRKVIFTSGATESANLAIRGTMDRYTDISKLRMITTKIEHPCVSEVFNHYREKSADTVYVGVDRYGQIDKQELYSLITPSTKLVSLIWVNNEIGSVQPVGEILRGIKKINPRTLVHIDAVQGFGKVRDDVSLADMITISGHKFHAPKGIGALIIKKDVTLRAQNLGGNQQDGYRSGTINTPCIVAMGKACEIIMQTKPEERMMKIRDYLYDRLSETFSGDIINTKIHEQRYAPHIMSISFRGLKGEVILHMLEEKNIFVSTASACSTHKKDKQAIISQIGLDRETAEGTIRISISEMTTKEEIDRFISELQPIIRRLEKLRGR